MFLQKSRWMEFANRGAKCDDTGSIAPVAFSGASVGQSVDQNLTGGANTTLAFDTSNYDVGGPYHSTTVNNSRLTIPSTGYYLLTFNTRINSVNPPTCYFILMLNGATVITVPSIQQAVMINQAVSCSLAWEGHLNAGDFLEIVVFTPTNCPTDHTTTVYTISSRGT